MRVIEFRHVLCLFDKLLFQCSHLLGILIGSLDAGGIFVTGATVFHEKLLDGHRNLDIEFADVSFECLTREG